MGILAVTVTPTWNSAQSHLNHQADLLARHIAHAQMLAMSHSTPLTFDLSATDYAVRDRDSGAVIIDPATGDPFSVTLQQGVLFSSWADFEIDTLGRLHRGGGLATSVVEQRLSGGSRTRLLQLQPVSGVVVIGEG